MTKTPKLFESCLANIKSTGRFCQIFVAFIEKLNFSWVALCVQVCFFEYVSMLH